MIESNGPDPVPRTTPPASGYLRASQAATILHVSPKTISRWAREGRLGHVVTLGGHRRFFREDIERLAEQLLIEPEAATS